MPTQAAKLEKLTKVRGWLVLAESRTRPRVMHACWLRVISFSPLSWMEAE